MFYIHKDIIYERDQWWRSFKISLNKHDKKFKLINVLDDGFQLPNHINPNDWLLGRFGHLHKDRSKISKIYKELYKKWNGNIFPTPKAYSLYDNKWREYKFLKKHGFKTLNSSIVKNENDLLTFIVETGINFPVVAKKPYGAGGKYVEKWNDISLVNNNFFPCIVQNYVEADHDVRLTLLNDVALANERVTNKNIFPYGDEPELKHMDDLLDLFDQDFVSKLHKIFVEQNDIPTVGFDILIKDGVPYILEFTYCFEHHIAMMSNHLYKLPEFEKIPFRKNRNERNLKSTELKTLTTDKIVEWIQNK